MTLPIQSEGGPTEQLLAHTSAILKLQERIRTRKGQRSALYGTGLSALLGALAIFVATMATWRTVDLAKVNAIAIPLTILCAIAWIVLAFMESGRDEEDRKSVRQLELELEIAEERRLLQASQLGVPVDQRQFTYKDSLPKELDQLRAEAQHYRRIHNAFQSLIILGSLGTTTAASLADNPGYLKWLTVGLSFAVGASAGFTGYFKYRERSFYLQQTADAIEQHATAFELGIPPYTGAEDENLSKLTQEVESLRVEQRKREQQLDQPHEGRDGTV
ncbi:hypothetical protein C9F11_27580 [Streptomyces sp. YIM 121038]|uniref:DUF4231 domain-containing protein n=1 Tax=Streptomyces sp. YIM 121038 TaxID=2136401 RepID=UPI0011633B11|nr:DUF4231 domain-containing protein [Streptomyces sp. YIM 121038]QCX79118.1 hypothetical protein C9F11_27580 [Streptomyces sp. YIM 121038]